MINQEVQDFLDPELRLMYLDAQQLLSTVTEQYSDYSFLVFPFAKLYEGFLKKLFYKTGAISQHQYESQRWRVGRALNPDLEIHLRKEESVYDRILELCGGKEVPNQLWEAWKRGRNQVFHYFPGKHKPMSFSDAKEIISKLELAMDAAIKSCRI